MAKTVLLTTTEAAERLNCSASRIRRFIDRAELPYTMAGSRYLIAEDDVENLLEELAANDDEAEDQDEEEQDDDDDDLEDEDTDEEEEA